MIKKILIPTLLYTTLSASCFTANDEVTINAQEIRLMSKKLGWEVGIAKSFTVSGIIKAKQAIYPDGKINVCIAENDGDLKFIMHSSSIEATEAKWYFLTGSKTGWF